MGKRIPRKPLKVSSIDDSVKPESETAVLENPAPEVKAATESKKVATETRKVVSPLLSEPVEIKEHAMGIGPESNSDLSGLKVDADFFSSQPVQPVNPPLTKNDLSEVKPVQSNIPPMKPDVPEQSFNPNPVGPESVPIPDNVARQAASELADTVMSIYERLVPEVSHEYSKINVKEIKKLEDTGDLMAGSYQEVVDQNKDNKKELERRAHEDAIMIKKPLKKLLEVKQINAPPHIELLIICIFVAITYFMMVRSIKKSNDDLLNKLYERINKMKQSEKGAKPTTDSDIPLTETEEIPN